MSHDQPTPEPDPDETEPEEDQEEPQPPAKSWDTVARARVSNYNPEHWPKG